VTRFDLSGGSALAQKIREEMATETIGPAGVM
jgi:hypothetical protein